MSRAVAGTVLAAWLCSLVHFWHRERAVRRDYRLGCGWTQNSSV